LNEFQMRGLLVQALRGLSKLKGRVLLHQLRGSHRKQGGLCLIQQGHPRDLLFCLVTHLGVSARI
jgi:hypothetical protein